MSPTAPPQLEPALDALHFAYPALVVFYFVLTLGITLCTRQTQRLRIQDEHVRRDLIIALSGSVAVSYLVEAITTVVRFFLSGVHPGQGLMVYLLSSAVVFGAETLALTDSKFPVWFPYYGTWLIGLTSELSFLIVSNVFFPPRSYFGYILIVEQVLRVCLFIALPIFYFSFRTDSKHYDNFDAERQSLLRKRLRPKNPDSEASTLNGNGYGTTTDANSNDSDTVSNADSEDSWLARERKAKEAIKKRLEQDGNWFTYAKGFTIFLPYLWPIHNKALQLRAVLVGCCLLAGNALNLLVPLWMGYMVKNLTAYLGGDETKGIWHPVFIFALLGFISGGACMGWLRRWLWMPIEQYSYDALSTASHAHIMSLSSDFHDGKTSSDLTQAINGGQSVFQLVETVLFQIIPMFIDLAVAFVYLWIVFGPFMGLVMASFVVTYLYVTTKLYATRAEKRREYITIYRKEWTIGQQSLDGWNTASLFNMIPYEEQRYGGAVKEHMKSKNDYEMSTYFITAVQSFVMTVGKVAALCLGVWKIYNHQNDIGEFTTLITYWSQLQGPLVFFSSMYRSVSHSLMDAERLLELFQTKPTITDAPTAKPLKLDRGLVRFEDVSFAYDERKPTLKNVTFTVPAGKTVALVGETGGGKSTILKLIDRFYDVKGGLISIDGQDIREITLSSLREKIGVVPQDPTLFNDSIMNNIRYARMSATDSEVHEACKAAAVHEKIISFPDGYDSKVGDRGVKLSGGEKQRVAIARAILKQPEIILLDEATSAVDTETEQVIQQGLNHLCRGRTTFIVAHRLSTIMKADTILVVMNGEIIEEGSHDSLVLAGGKYFDLWSKQIFVKPASNKDRKKRDKDVINDITDAESTMNLVQALGKASPDEGNNKKDAKSTSQKGEIEGYTKQMGYEDEQPFTKKCGLEQSGKEIPSSSIVKSSGGETPKSNRGREMKIPSRASSTKVIIKEALRTPKKLEREEKKRHEKERKSASWSKKSSKRVTKILEPAAGDPPNIDGAHSPEPSKAEEAEESVEIVIEGLVGSGRVEDPSFELSSESQPVDGQSFKNLKPKRKRYSRRHASRSEPAGKAPDFSFGASRISKGASTVLGEGQPSVPDIPKSYQQTRRVSAPSDPPSGQQERRNTGRKRPRHWRLKNRTGASTSTGVSSGVGMSSEDVVRPCPPLSSPAGRQTPTRAGHVAQPAKVTFVVCD